MDKAPDNRAAEGDAAEDDAGYAGLIAIVLVVALTIAVSISVLVTLPEALDAVTQQRSGWLGGGSSIATGPGMEERR